MTQVLARKWRPRSFRELVGQEHVVRALTNALREKRLHHAYLFTGTRGVGKTTLARIIAKSLNCEAGVSDTPCGTCATCAEVDAGRFVDLIELDAASNTQVDSMRELLENALYAPTAGRYKVYIIDEVHMLSRNAFNAMLKTLEEPPEHVKFVLATTDPQKIPVTVLSRCLQFNLKQIPQQQIDAQLRKVLDAEELSYDPGALALIARAAQGSMRDALSLLDQAIAHSGGNVDTASTRAMLGSVDQTYLQAILRALAAGDGARLMAEADRMAERSLDFETALQDLASLLHRLALIQIVPQVLDEEDPDAPALRELAALFTAEELQLHYQIAIQSRSEIGLAPDEYAGFTMALLRMLAFAPAGDQQRSGCDDNVAGRDAPRTSAAATRAGSARARVSGAAESPPREQAPAMVSRSERTARMAAPEPSDVASASPKATGVPASEPLAARNVQPTGIATPESMAAPGAQPAPSIASPEPIESPNAPPAANIAARAAATNVQPDVQWGDLVERLGISGMARMLAQHCELATLTADRVELTLARTHERLLEKPYHERIRGALQKHFGRPLHVSITIGEDNGNSPKAIADRERQARQAQAIAEIEQDSFVRDLVENFDAKVNEGSIRPVDLANTGNVSVTSSQERT